MLGSSKFWFSVPEFTNVVDKVLNWSQMSFR